MRELEMVLRLIVRDHGTNDCEDDCPVLLAERAYL
jgi:hypothetical protein